jgi:hypothetical protein
MNVQLVANQLLDILELISRIVIRYVMKIIKQFLCLKLFVKVNQKIQIIKEWVLKFSFIFFKIQKKTEIVILLILIKLKLYFIFFINAKKNY